MPSARKRKPAVRDAQWIEGARDTRASFEENSRAAKGYDAWAKQTKDEITGTFMRKADRNRIRTAARQFRRDASSPNVDYTDSRPDLQRTRHNLRYRNIRRAFGLSAG